MRIDSLFTKVSITNSYISNLTDILTGNIDTISYTASPDSIRQILPVDSITGTSDREKQFVRQFEEKEKFNLSVLSPIVAEGMAFYTPVKGAVVPETGKVSSGVSLVTPYTTPVSSIYDGTVIECYYTSATENTVIVQHPNDFISKYSGLSEIFITKGDRLHTGDRIGIALSRPGNDSRLIKFELWHNGTPLNPLEYISF